MGQDNGVEKYLKALAHPARRKVLVALAEKKSLSYSELMRIAGIEDSGTFAFHLRMLQGLVEKDPNTGEYRLTEEGYKAYRALKILYGEEKPREPTIEKSTVEKEEKKEVIVISDKLSFDLTRKLAEKLASEGKRILITDVVTVNIEDMPEELLDKVLEGMRDVLVVNVPKHLKHIVDLKSKDVFITGKGGIFGGFIGGLVRTIVNAVASSVAKAPWQAISKGEKFHAKLTGEVPPEYSIKASIDASKVSFSPNTSSREIVVEGEFYRGSEPKLNIDGDKASIEIDVGSATILYPKGLSRVDIKVDASTIDGVIEDCVRELSIESDASNIDLEIGKLGKSVFHLGADASNIDLDIEYSEYEGESEITVDADVSNISMRIIVPRDTRIQAFIEEGTGFIDIDGYMGKHYIDKDYDNAKSRLKIIAKNDSGNTKIRITRK
ncbi:helix-turn-helix domain-containing protein [Desulfurococcaceae archaeon MEX13E-LK6-19]|nr:helix-turn-helix domain-containing protein [Desulfurococcaceae archaeon MEX13E-LK6-19]